MAKINYKSDFDFILTLRDAQGNDIGFPNFDWEARFWTFSLMHTMTASCRGGECINCFNDNNKIHIVVNAPALGCGRLQVEMVTHHENDIYPDGERTVYTPDALDIELVNGKGDTETTAKVEVVLPTTSTEAKALPRIEVRVYRDKHADITYNKGRTYLRLLNAQPYLEAGYKPVLLRKCVRKQAYRKKGDDDRLEVHTKGWHIRGGQITLRLNGIVADPLKEPEHLVAITGSKTFVSGEDYSLNAIDFVKPHSPYYPRGAEEEYKYINDIVVSWGCRPMRIYDEDGGENEEPVVHSPIRFKFGIAFQKDSNFDNTRLNLPISEIVSNIATFSVVFSGSSKESATDADYYHFEY